jgi:hypothetical protein
MRWQDLQAYNGFSAEGPAGHRFSLRLFMMIQFPQLRWLSNVKRVLMMVLAVLALLSFGLASFHALHNIHKMLNWSEYPGEVTAVTLAEQGLVEIEVPIELVESLPDKILPESCFPHAEGNTCLIVPRSHYAWIDVFDPIDVLQNPNNLGQIELAITSGLWLPVASYWLAAMLLAGLRKWLGMSVIGEDLTWVNGHWVTTVSALNSVCSFAVEPQVIRETTGSRKAVVFWTVVFAFIGLSGISAAVFEADVNLFNILLITVISWGILGVALYAAIETHTRAIYQDQKGFLDSHFFTVKRIPWSAVASIELVNLSREAQERFDRSSYTRRKGPRPASINVYRVQDCSGRDIVHLSEKMIPVPSFKALVARLGQVAKTMTTSPIESVQELQIFEQDENIGHEQSRHSYPLNRPVPRISAAMLIILAPFLLATCVLSYESLWFQYAAEQTEGRIVEISSESLPSLIVEYTTQKTGSLRIESDGTEAYQVYRIGDTVTVYYDPANPGDARLDLFLELWLGPMVAGGFSIGVFLLIVLIRRNFAAATTSR